MSSQNNAPEAAVAITATIKSFPPSGGKITDFTLSGTVQNGGNWLTFASQKIHASVKIPPPGPTGHLAVPTPNTKLTFTFAAPGFLVTDVPDFASRAFECQKVKTETDGTATIAAVATPRAIKEGLVNVKYSIKLQQTGSSNEWLIDPDFETDVTTGNA
jgi:hypothetical protein